MISRLVSRSSLRSAWLLLVLAAGGCIDAADGTTESAPGAGVGTAAGAAADSLVEVEDALSSAVTCGGPRGLGCRKGDYCATPANTCPGAKQRGVCRARPQVCSNIASPVCGCDGQTYANPCRAAAAATSVAHAGECSKPNSTCRDSGECSDGTYCQKPAGACGDIGTCAVKPQVCIQSFDAVCGCDGNTYANSCIAAASGASVGSAGACPAKQLCGGIAGLPCPGGAECVDDPDDGCDPSTGGSDCGGVCRCEVRVPCIPGFHFDSSPGICACVSDLPATCGNLTCPVGQLCCNASCGICTPPGFACVQVACVSSPS